MSHKKPKVENSSQDAAEAQRTRRSRREEREDLSLPLSARPPRSLRLCGEGRTVIRLIIVITVLSAFLSLPLSAQIPAQQQSDPSIRIAPLSTRDLPLDPARRLE